MMMSDGTRLTPLTLGVTEQVHPDREGRRIERPGDRVDREIAEDADADQRRAGLNAGDRERQQDMPEDGKSARPKVARGRFQIARNARQDGREDQCLEWEVLPDLDEQHADALVVVDHPHRSVDDAERQQDLVDDAVIGEDVEDHERRDEAGHEQRHADHGLDQTACQ